MRSWVAEWTIDSYNACNIMKTSIYMEFICSYDSLYKLLKCLCFILIKNLRPYSNNEICTCEYDVNMFLLLEKCLVCCGFILEGYSS